MEERNRISLITWYIFFIFFSKKSFTNVSYKFLKTYTKNMWNNAAFKHKNEFFRNQVKNKEVIKNRGPIWSSWHGAHKLLSTPLQGGTYLIKQRYSINGVYVFVMLWLPHRLIEALHPLLVWAFHILSFRFVRIFWIVKFSYQRKLKGCVMHICI